MTSTKQSSMGASHGLMSQNVATSLRRMFVTLDDLITYLEEQGDNAAALAAIKQYREDYGI